MSLAVTFRDVLGVRAGTSSPGSAAQELHEPGPGGGPFLHHGVTVTSGHFCRVGRSLDCLTLFQVDDQLIDSAENVTLGLTVALSYRDSVVLLVMFTLVNVTVGYVTRIVTG